MIRRALVSLAALALALSACSSEPGPVVELGEIERASVTQTIAAPASLEPRDRVVVSATASGTVAELFVGDGDEVAVGDPLVRLTSPSVESTIAQAEAAVAAADALSRVQVGVDLSPLVGAVRQQFESVFPELFATLGTQARELPEEQQAAALAALERATTAYNDAVANLAAAEADAAAAAQRASASQRAAAEAQGAQAQLALDAARSRAEDLTITAPAAGVVELTRGGGTGGAADLGALSDLGSSGLGDLEGLIGGSAPASGGTGPIAVGSEVAAGQSLLTIYDLSEFRALAFVDEIDIVEVDPGQRGVVLIDAYPDAELTGTVEHVAVEPEAGATGGVTYAVTIRLLRIPPDVRLRVGLSGSVEIATRTVDDAVTVPSSALRRRGDADVVFVVRDDVIREVSVVVTAVGDDVAAVEGGLEVGESIVVSGIEDVADGDPVP